MLFANLWSQASKDLQAKEESQETRKEHTRFLAVFDFDYTISETDTFFTVHEQLHNGKQPLLAELQSGGLRSDIPYEQKVFQQMHDKGVTSRDIQDVIESIPGVQGLEDVLRFLKEHNSEVIIISDSNTLFIDDWLKHNNLQDCVDCVFTNTAYYDESGCLRVDGYHRQDTCSLSNSNLCKGDILEKYVQKRASEGTHFFRIAYFGDGTNDICPCLRLSEKDLVFPRVGFPFYNKLKENAHSICEKIKALIYPWKTGDDILFVLEQLKSEF